MQCRFRALAALDSGKQVGSPRRSLVCESSIGYDETVIVFGEKWELVMAAAVLTPRIRLMTACVGVRESKTEAGVFHVKGLRQGIVVNGFPFVPSRLWLFLVLSSHRPGEYPGYIRVLDDRTDKAIFYWKLAPMPTFRENDEVMTCSTWIRCAFPEPGRYTMQVWFFQEQGSDVLKGEMPFSVTSEGA